MKRIVAFLMSVTLIASTFTQNVSATEPMTGINDVVHRNNVELQNVALGKSATAVEINPDTSISAVTILDEKEKITFHGEWEEYDDANSYNGTARYLSLIHI